jgi:hypothetical protein
VDGGAGYAYPKTLFVAAEALPFTVAAIESHLQALSRYDVDIFLAAKRSNLRLWAKGSGYDAAGVGYLLATRKQENERRRQRGRINQDERLAIRNCGIAVVKQVEDQWVFVLVSSRARKIPRKKFVGRRATRAGNRTTRGSSSAERWDKSVIINRRRRRARRLMQVRFFAAASDKVVQPGCTNLGLT